MTIKKDDMQTNPISFPEPHEKDPRKPFHLKLPEELHNEIKRECARTGITQHDFSVYSFQLGLAESKKRPSKKKR